MQSATLVLGMSLGSLIVQRGIASIREIEEALARQVLYGGDFLTNLFEVSRIEEAAVVPIVAEFHRLPPGPVGELPKASAEALRIIASEVVAERGFAPLEVGSALVVAVDEPLSPDVEQELGFALALPIEQRLAPRFRIRQALARDYGLPIDKRTTRLITKVVQKGPRMASAAPPPHESVAKFRPPPRPPSIAPPPARVEVPSRGPSAYLGTFVREREGTSLPPVRRRRGPLTADAARTELDSSAERDGIFDVLFEFTRQFFDYTALFVVHGDIAEGRDAFGDGASREKVARVGVPLDLDNVLAVTRARRAPHRAVPASDGIDPVLMSDLGRAGTTECIVFPIVVRSRVVALLLGDGGVSGIDDEGVRQVTELVAASSGAFERVIVRRKLKADARVEHGVAVARRNAAPSMAPPATRRSAAPAAPARRSGAPGAPADELAAPIRELLAAPPDPEPVAAASAVASTLRTTATPASSVAAPATSPAESPPARGTLDGGPFLRSPTDEPPPMNLLRVRRPSGRPIPREEPEAEMTPAIPKAAPVPAFTASTAPPGLTATAALAAFAGTASFGPEPTASVEPGPTRTRSQSLRRAQAPDLQFSRPLTAPDPDATPLAPAVRDPDLALTPLAPSVGAIDAVDANGVGEPVLSLSQRKVSSVPVVKPRPRKPMPASEQQISVAAHRPPTSLAEQAGPGALPSIIVDVRSEYDALVERVLAGPNEDVEAVLLRAGPAAMPAIMAKFPGPITVDRERLEGTALPRVSECGPVLRLIAGQRRTALAPVLERVDAEDAEARFWATFLLTELVYAEAVGPAVTRVFDEDVKIRRVARAAVRALAEAQPRAVVEQLGEIARSAPDRRLAAIDALGESREPFAVPVLLPMLDDGDAAIADAAHAALVQITQQDFARDGERWLEWWGENRDRHRLEWLIDSLMHEQRALRTSSSEELRAITKEFFGYYDDLPKRERERAQARYREWWQATGRLRFSRGASRGA